MKRILAHPELPDEKIQELEAEVQTIESQSKSPKPKIQIIKDALSSAKGIIEEAAGVAGAAAHNINWFMDKWHSIGISHFLLL